MSENQGRIEGAGADADADVAPFREQARAALVAALQDATTLQEAIVDQIQAGALDPDSARAIHLLACEQATSTSLLIALIERQPAGEAELAALLPALSLQLRDWALLCSPDLSGSFPALTISGRERFLAALAGDRASRALRALGISSLLDDHDSP